MAATLDITAGLKGSDRVQLTCGKCGGSGRLGTLVDAGRCWPCDSTGQVSILVSSFRARGRNAAGRAAADAARVETLHDKHTAAIEALRAAGFADIDDRLADPKVTYLAQDILFLVRDHGSAPAEAFAEWLTRFDEQFNPRPRNPPATAAPAPARDATPRSQ